MLLRFSALCAVVLGCGGLDAETGEPQTNDVAQDLLTCDEFMCGTNSPQIAEFGFWELNVPSSLAAPGLPNNVGMQVLGFVKNGGVYLPRVKGGRLYAAPTTTTAPYNTALSGSGLVGGAIWLVNHGRYFQLRVAEVGSVASWAHPPGGTKVMLESYKLDWTELINGHWGDFRNLCPHPPGRENPDTLTMFGQASFQTLLFEGDRIEATKKLDTGVDRTWFNLGCAGSALAKLALTGHTEAARTAGTFYTTLGERQAMLKMLTADYCGDGTPFTVAGQPLNWRDDHKTMLISSLVQSPPHPVVFEARWKETGAACLNKPRVDVKPTALATQTFGSNLYDQVKHHCPDQMPPECSDDDFDNMDGYHLLSVTPL